ncbi:germination protein YpeB [Paenibacillus sp. YYML68]|uniref:germination protein YpeB n=1 Tax=Paenibacillus sp. YYML68 TaxID=2909250 RepID=UPI0024938189|nr:germination protein YpeB [Paenibacillus sp. YYML68]
MYKRLSIVMFPILLVALIGTGIWGYMEHQEKNSVLIKAENQYQRAFHDLTFHVDKLHTELGNTLAVNSTSQEAYKKGLINVWRITNEAQNEISQLPLTLLPFNETEQFLANISKFAYRAAVRDLSKQPFTEAEMKTMKSLYEHSKQISDDLRQVQSTVVEQNLRWMDVELALATKSEPYDNDIIDGFATLDKKVSEYAEVNWSPSVMSMFEKRDVSMLSGNEMTVDDIKQRAAQFLGVQSLDTAQIVENGVGTEYASYSVYIPKEGTLDGAHMDFAKKGGQLLWYNATRDVQTRALDLRQARDVAAQFLDEHGYTGMTAVSYDDYANVANLTFASREGDAINYLEKVAVKVALDNGEVTGLEATDYVFNNKERQLPAPTVTVEDAKKTLNPEFKLDSVSQALIRNEIDEEVLCYQFMGRVNGGYYRIFINAATGTEEKIDYIQADEVQVAQ